jgi:diguanylate cyclase (GGDEF)-like protein
MTANQIGKETIQTLAKNRLVLTPENYTSTFCTIAKDKGFIVEDCNKIEKFMDKLNPVFQADLNKYNVNTPDELMTYLVATLNRISSTGEGKLSLTLITLVKRILQSITMLHNKEARDLANASLERIEHLADENTFKIMKDKWFEFLTNYDSTHVGKLKEFGDFKSDDFSSMVDEMYQVMQKKDDSKALEPISKLIIASLTPSIASSMDDDLAGISYEIRNSPSLLADSSFQEEIKGFIKRRVELDKAEVKEKIKSIDGLLGNVSNKILNLIENSNLSRDKIKGIKDELVALDFTKHSFEMMKERLVTIANSLEVEVDSLSGVMIEDEDVVKKLKLKVHKLELALGKAKKETRLDFLTNLISKRGLDEDLNRAEKSYERYGIDYSIVFFDLDKFKMLNDTFGHEAGDVVLKQTGAILNQIKRDVDIVGRYGGEEFLALLPNTPLNGAKVFAQKVRSGIEEFKFLYKGERLTVTVSGGCVNRKDFSDQKSMIEASDQLLYRAKEAGRNRIYSKDD